MKTLHRPDLLGWSRFDEARDIDFNSVLWTRSGGDVAASGLAGGSATVGNVAVDPLPLSDHDAAHLERVGGCAIVVLTTSDHVRAAADVVRRTGARVYAPAGERDRPDLFPGVTVDRWLSDGDEIVPGLVAMAMEGSKTPGELALVLAGANGQGSTVITGDLVRSHAADAIRLLPDAKIVDRAAAIRSVRRLAELPDVQAVLVGDGFPLYRDGGARLRQLAGGLA